MAKIIDGKALAKGLRQKIAEEVIRLKSTGLVPGLAVVLVGENPASQIYVQNKIKACEATGIESVFKKLPADVSEEKLLKIIGDFNQNPKVHGILVQLPLPSHIDVEKVVTTIDPQKDVDGLHPYNLGRLNTQNPSFIPCTPQGILYLIESTGISIEGKEACVLGRSEIVGRPTAILLTHKNATVTVCHSRTQNIAEKISRADILVAAIGKPKFVQGEWIKKGAIVIDVGINRLPDGKFVGDVDFESASKRAGFITPVPGGVGPMTIAMLLKNTVFACQHSKEKS